MSTKEQIFANYKAEYDLYKKYAKYISPKYISLNCNAGWLDILREFFEFCDVHNYPIQVIQIKEKFGILRVSYRPEKQDAEFFSALGTILAQAATTCDVCGGVGEMRDGGWIKTRCDTHVDTRLWDGIPYQELLDAVDPLRAELHQLIGRK